MSSDNQLAFLDQASFLGLRATGFGQLAQWVWIYERDIDIEGLRRFHRNLGETLLGRRIECSPLPFGRHRWVSSRLSPSLDLDELVRPRAELTDWTDERAQLPIDPELGPSWHLGAARFADGSSAVSLVASHTVTDGLGGNQAIVDAVKGRTRDFGYPPPHSRTRLRAALSDVRETLRGAPAVAGAFVAIVKLARRSGPEMARSKGAETIVATVAPGGQDEVIVPAITVYLDMAAWDARAEALGGTTNALFNGFAARLGERMGRRRAEDGLVGLRFPVSDRTEDDTRANALASASIDVDPTLVTTDLSAVRTAIKQSLAAMDEPDDALAVLPLTPLIPHRAARRLGAALFTDFSVGTSNLRDIDPATNRPDGTEADFYSLRGVTQHITRQVLDGIRGQVTLASGRINGKVFITLVAYQPGGENSKAALRELAGQTLAEFGLSGTIE